MNKQTQMYVGLGVLAVAGYLVWKKMADKKAEAAEAAKVAAGTPEATAPATAAFVGGVGNVKKFVGKMGANGLPVGVSQNATVADYNWSNATGYKGFHK